MDNAQLTVAVRLLLAVIAGSIIGLERTYHGRPAGFRTHTLVCTASSLLMLLVLEQWQHMPAVATETIRLDPTRMAQGIMTGIGFLGAGVIMKEQFTIRGLTTAASIWATAAIGIVIGMGMYFAAALAALLTLGTLGVFRWIESNITMSHYGRLMMR
ncbi:MAG TPA: MgtC/SapB family protein, partial [Gammaproteobacteria bacterium]|nr:MgtC/SapB family protein [Gammaproteobacteria bacterium]